MKLTKFAHSCVRLDDGDRALVFDPGVFSDAAAALDGADAVLITHEHPDHLDADALRAAAGRNPGLRIWAPAGVTRSLADLGEQVSAVGPDEQFDAAGFPVRTFGGQHALIHPLIPMVANVAYLVADEVYHPGDSFVVPSDPVGTALIPLHAPWSKTAEVIDFAVSVRAPRAFQIHDALLTDTGRGMVEGHVGRLAAQHGSSLRHLDVEQSVDL